MTIQKRLKNGLKFAAIALMAIVALCLFAAWVFSISHAINQGDGLRAFLILVVGVISGVFTIGCTYNE